MLSGFVLHGRELDNDNSPSFTHSSLSFHTFARGKNILNVACYCCYYLQLLVGRLEVTRRWGPRAFPVLRLVYTGWSIWGIWDGAGSRHRNVTVHSNDTHQHIWETHTAYLDAHYFLTCNTTLFSVLNLPKYSSFFVNKPGNTVYFLSVSENLGGSTKSGDGRAFQFGQKSRFDSIRRSDKFAACTLIFK